MATFITDFSSETVGAMPSGWVSAWASNTTWSVQTDSGTGKKLLRGVSPANGAEHHIYNPTWGNSTNCEVVMKFRIIGATSTAANQRTAVAFTNMITGNGFYNGAMVDKSSGGVTQAELMTGSDGGDFLATAPYTLTTNTWYWLRVRNSGTSMYVKTWADGSSEPASWQITTTLLSTPYNGPMGIGNYYNNSSTPITYEFYQVGIANAGETAPTYVPQNITGSSTIDAGSDATATGSVYSTTKTSATATVGTGGGAWTNIGNVFAEDGAVASGDISTGGAVTNPVALTGWGFNIPNSAIITGIKVEVKDSGSSYQDYPTGTKLIKNGVQAGRSRSNSYGTVAALTWHSHGGQYDTWGINWTPADINSANFGYNLQYNNISGGGTVSVDAVRITVYYDAPPLYTILQSFEGNTFKTYGNQGLATSEAIHEVTNNTGSPLPFKQIRYRWAAYYGIVGGDPKSGTGGTTYDRTGTPYTVRAYTTQADANAMNSNYLKEWTGTLTSISFVDYTFDLGTTNYTIPVGGKLWFTIVCTGVSGASEPGFVEIFGATANPDANQSTYYNGAYTGGGTWTADTFDFDYLLYGTEAPITVNLSSDSTAVTDGTVVASSIAPLSSDSDLTATGTVTRFGTAALSSDSDSYALGNVGLFASFNQTADSTATTSGSIVVYGGVTWSSDSNLDVSAVRTAVTGASLSGDSVASVNSGGVDVTHLTIQKSYMYKIYDRDWNYLGVWNDVVSQFGYSQEVNSAGSSITVTLARNSDSLVANYDVLADDSNNPLITDTGDNIAAETTTTNAIGPGTTVDLNLNVVIYEFSTGPQDLQGDIVFTGYISMYTSKYGNTENTDVSIFSYGADLDNYLLTDQTGNTRVPYLSQDPSSILKDTLDRFKADGGIVTYDAASIESPSLVLASPWNVSYTFNLNTELEVIKKCIELAPTDWYFYLDMATNKLHYHPRPTAVSHQFFLGKHIYNLNLERSMEGVINDMVVTGGKLGAIATDNFYGSTLASVPLLSHTGELGATWTKHPASGTGTVSLFDGRAFQNAGLSIYLASGVAASSNYTVRSDIKVLSALGDIGIIGRADPTAETFYMARLTSDGQAQILKAVNGSYTVLQSTGFALTTGSTYSLSLTFLDNKITLKIDGVKILELLDGSITAGTRSGIRTGDSAVTVTTGLQLNNFNVTNIVSDSFIDSLPEPLETHVGELNATWAKHPAMSTGSLVVANDRVRQNAGVAVYLVNGVSPSNDYIIKSEYKVLSLAGDIGIIGRCDPASLTFYMARLTTSNTAELFKCINGTFTQIASIPFTVTAGATYALEFSMIGSRITLRVGSNTVLDVDDSSITTGYRSGIRTGDAAVGSNTGIQLNNFKVTNTNDAGPAIFKRYIDSNSASLYRRGLNRINDNRVTVEASADVIASSQITRNREPRYRSSITIANSTYPIRTIKLGQLVGFRNFGNYVDNVTMQIVRLDYTPDSVTLQLDTLLPSVPKRLEDVKRNLTQSDVEDNPDAPTGQLL